MSLNCQVIQSSDPLTHPSPETDLHWLKKRKKKDK